MSCKKYKDYEQFTIDEAADLGDRVILVQNTKARAILLSITLVTPILRHNDVELDSDGHLVYTIGVDDCIHEIVGCPHGEFEENCEGFTGLMIAMPVKEKVEYNYINLYINKEGFSLGQVSHTKKEAETRRESPFSGQFVKTIKVKREVVYGN